MNFVLRSICVLFFGPAILFGYGQVVDLLQEFQSSEYTVSKKAINDRRDGGYYTMHFDGTVDLQYGPEVNEINYDALWGLPNVHEILIHIDSLENVVWHLDSMRFNDLDVDKEGGVAIIASCAPLVDIDPGEGSLKLPGPGSSIVAYYDYNGILQFAHRLPISGVYFAGVAFAENGDIIVTGNFSESMDIDPSLDEVMIEPVQGDSPFIIRYSSIGEVVNVQVFNTPELHGGDLVSLTTGTIYWLISSSVMGPYPNTHYIAQGTDTLWISQGTFGALHLLELAEGFEVLGIHTIESEGTIGNEIRLSKLSSTRFALSGRPTSVGDLDPDTAVTVASAGGPFIAEYDISGSLLWHWFPQSNGQLRITGVALSATNELYVCGSFSGEITLSSLSDPDILLSSPNDQDGFLTKWDQARDLIYAFDYGGPSTDQASAVYTSENGVWLWGDVRTPSDIQPGLDEVIVSPEGTVVAFRAHYANDILTVDVAPINRESSYDIRLYPNPNSGHFLLSISGAQDVIVLDITGRVVRKIMCQEGMTHFDISDLSPGRYALRFGSEGSQTIWVTKL